MNLPLPVAAPAGTVSVTEKAPDASVGTEPRLVVFFAASMNETRTLTLRGKPVPETVAVVPAGPLEGETLTAALSTRR